MVTFVSTLRPFFIISFVTSNTRPIRKFSLLICISDRVHPICIHLYIVMLYIQFYVPYLFYCSFFFVFPYLHPTYVQFFMDPALCPIPTTYLLHSRHLMMSEFRVLFQLAAITPGICPTFQYVNTVLSYLFSVP